ncbi:B2 bradykinin receptor-like [Centropristis striata]|uniref:B2 bradykinin receptor-like n=1 Tax=Centropristis striata TaxID=184440 RepID=UPI0027DF53D2|nr:B2 bradykinin receptor-like [Centropristis striata]
MSLPSPGIPAINSTAGTYGDQNNTNGSTCAPYDNELEATVIPVYILMVSVLGFLLNAFVLMVFCLHKKACTVAEIYLSNMAAADFILMAFLPFWAVNPANKYNWTLPHSLCKLVPLSINVNTYSSIYFLVLISIDRYVALVLPMSNKRMRRPKYAKLCCALVWGFSLLLSVPTLVYREAKYIPDQNVTRCLLNYPNNETFLLFDVMLLTFGFIIPISIISYCTLKIIQALKNRLPQSLKKEQKATTLMLAVLLAFMICWVPFYLVKILRWLIVFDVLRGCSIRTIVPLCKQIFVYFAFFNSVLNPILYVIVGKNFRAKVREVFNKSRIHTTTSFNTNSTRSRLMIGVKTHGPLFIKRA